MQEPPYYAKMAYQYGKKVQTPGYYAEKVFQYGRRVQTPPSQAKMQYFTVPPPKSYRTPSDSTGLQWSLLGSCRTRVDFSKYIISILFIVFKNNNPLVFKST